MWNAILKRSLLGLDGFLKKCTWDGRENEVVNLYAHDYLVNEISPEGPFKSLSQVGIEVAVLQVTGSINKYVRKDLVIWSQPQMTVWTDNSSPAVIMEWKRNIPAACGPDIEWLSKFTSL